MKTIWTSALALTLTVSAALAEHCRETTFEKTGFAVCEARAGEDLRLYLNDPDGTPIGTFERLSSTLAERGQTLVFAMNAGMYHPDRRPVGLYVEGGKEVSRLITSPGPGNFGLAPNGVFCIRESGFTVIETRQFHDEHPVCQFATQSGPMLVIGGVLHPRFLADSDSRYIRNGVGVTAAGTRAYYAVSDAPLNFPPFARVLADAPHLHATTCLDRNHLPL